MATLKSIKNKYLDTDDGTVLGVTTNTENISLLSFKLATADSLSKFNLVDGFSDDYQDATGVDASGSTNEDRDSTGKYYVGQTSVTPTVSGNYNSTAVDGAYTWYKWTSTGSGGTYTTDTAQDYEYLVIAGGGSGAAGHGGTGTGGGGAGGYRTATGFPVAATTISGITVGLGGVSYTSGNNGQQGGNSVFSTITSTGGGRGNYGNSNGPPGGSGGGGGCGSPAGTQTGGPGNQGGYTPVEGYAGGNGQPGGSVGAGGGGGASEAGDPGSGATGGPGGDGRSSSIDGSATVRGGGGGGSGGTAGSGAGGTGGGGGGSTNSDAVAGTANTGSGGGGSRSSYNSGAGGTGIVIIRRSTIANQPGGNMTLASNAFTAQADPETIRIIMDEYTSTGSATVNVDIKAYASRDNGTTYTQITTLADQGTIETNHRLLSGSVDVSGQPAGSNVKYKIETLNQSASKITRVYGTSMAWA